MKEYQTPRAKYRSETNCAQFKLVMPHVGGRDVHISPSDLRFASRILRTTEWLTTHDVFDSIDLIGLNEGDLPHEERVDDKRTIYRFPMSRNLRQWGPLFRAIAFLLWYYRILQYYFKKEIACINAHSLSVLPLCAILKFAKRKPLIYEPHELETEVSGATGLRRVIAKLVERSLIGLPDEIVTVSAGIGRWYQQTYRLPRVWIVRNLAAVAESTPIAPKYFHRKYGINPSQIVFLYQGLVSAGRGIEAILDAFRGLPSDKHVVLMGHGDLVVMAKTAAAKYDSIHYHEAVMPGELCRYTAAADVGLVIIEDCCLSYTLCFPNKFSECLFSGLPVIVGDNLDIADVVRTYDCGWTSAASPADLANVIRNIDRDAIECKKAGALRWASQNSWQSETKILSDVYASVRAAIGKR